MCAVRTSEARLIWVVLGALVATPGCRPIFAPVNDLPPELAFVVQNKTIFSQDEDDPLAQVVAGTVMDDLVNLGGCWGSFDVLDVDATPPDVDDERVSALIPDALPVEDYEAYVFDSETGEMSWLVLGRDVWGLVSLVSTFTGAFSVVEESRLVFTTTHTGFNDPDTGNITLREYEGRFERLVTLSGDRLKLKAVPDSDQGDQVSRDHLVFRRFDCPQ